MPSHPPLRKWVFFPTIWNTHFWTRNNYSFPHWFHPFLLEKNQLVRLPFSLRGHVPEQLCLVHLLFHEQQQYFPSTLTAAWKHDFLISKACSAMLTEESMNSTGSQWHLFGLLWWSGESTPGHDALLACSNYRTCKLLKSPRCIFPASWIVPWNRVGDWELVVVEE